jgi:hypothetical protein
MSTQGCLLNQPNILLKKQGMISELSGVQYLMENGKWRSFGNLLLNGLILIHPKPSNSLIQTVMG